jgi:hypothetical protein
VLIEKILFICIPSSGMSRHVFDCFLLCRYTNLDGGYDRNPYNCELSDLSARDFDRYRDMVEDRDYELFTRSQFSSCIQSFNNLGK